MPIQGLDSDKCRQRNRVAARGGFNAFPFTLLTGEPAESAAKVVQSRGNLPKTPAEALKRINAVRVGERPLTLNDVYIHYAEAGNSNYVGKYAMFLGDSTLKNIASKADDGIAFMNSHRTGGMSEPTELPYGRTFAGRFEMLKDENNVKSSRLIVGFYMAAGIHPNGKNGPSTDDLDTSINAGTVFDVSLGMGRGGDSICDVCGKNMDMRDDDGDDICLHVPGTTYKMTTEEIEAQEARGVPGGVCSFTLENGTAGEVSAVFDGAVPGAGFRKALSFARAGRLDAIRLAEARDAFGPVMRDGDFRAPDWRKNLKDEIINKGDKKVQPDLSKFNLAEAFGFWLALGKPDTLDLTALASAIQSANPPELPPAMQHKLSIAAPGPIAAPGMTPEMESLNAQVTQLSEQLDAERKERETERDRNRRETVEVQAKAFANEQVTLHRAAPAERATIHSMYARAALDDAAAPVQMPYQDPTDGSSKMGTRVDALKASYARRQPHSYTSDLTGQNPAERAAATAALSTFGNEGDKPVSTGDLCAAGAREWALRRNGKKSGSNGSH